MAPESSSREQEVQQPISRFSEKREGYTTSFDLAPLRRELDAYYPNEQGFENKFGARLAHFCRSFWVSKDLMVSKIHRESWFQRNAVCRVGGSDEKTSYGISQVTEGAVRSILRDEGSMNIIRNIFNTGNFPIDSTMSYTEKTEIFGFGSMIRNDWAFKQWILSKWKISPLVNMLLGVAYFLRDLDTMDGKLDAKYEKLEKITHGHLEKMCNLKWVLSLIRHKVPHNVEKRSWADVKGFAEKYYAEILQEIQKDRHGKLAREFFTLVAYNAGNGMPKVSRNYAMSILVCRRIREQGKTLVISEDSSFLPSGRDIKVLKETLRPAAKRDTPESREVQDGKYYVLGDSIAAGMRKSGEAGLTLPGRRTFQLLRALDEQKPNLSGKTVLIHVGTNDVLDLNGSRDMSVSAGRLGAISQKCFDFGASRVEIGKLAPITHWNGLESAYQQHKKVGYKGSLEQYTAEINARIVQLNAEIDKLQKSNVEIKPTDRIARNAADGVHYDPAALRPTFVW